MENPEIIENWSFPKSQERIKCWNSQQNTKIVNEKIYPDIQPQRNLAKRSLSSEKQKNFRVTKQIKQATTYFQHLHFLQIVNRQDSLTDMNNFLEDQSNHKSSNSKGKISKKKEIHMSNIELSKDPPSNLIELTNSKAMNIRELLTKVKLNPKQQQFFRPQHSKQKIQKKIDQAIRHRPAYTLWFNKVKERRKIFKKLDKSIVNKDLIFRK